MSWACWCTPLVGSPCQKTGASSHGSAWWAAPVAGIQTCYLPVQGKPGSGSSCTSNPVQWDQCRIPQLCFLSCTCGMAGSTSVEILHWIPSRFHFTVCQRPELPTGAHRLIVGATRIFILLQYELLADQVTLVHTKGKLGEKLVNLPICRF